MNTRKKVKVMVRSAAFSKKEWRIIQEAAKLCGQGTSQFIYDATIDKAEECLRRKNKKR